MIPNIKNISALFNKKNREERDEIRYIYDAAGNKLSKEVTSGGITQLTDYIGGIQYTDPDKNDAVGPQLDFIAHSEGRIKKKEEDGSYVYHYDLKDHLGNVRLTYAADRVTDTYKATMESELAVEEEAMFGNIAETRQLDQIFNATPAGEVASPDESAFLNPAFDKIIGPTKSLAVRKGDQVTATVQVRYADSNTSNTLGNIGFINAIVGAFTGVSGIDGQVFIDALNIPGVFSTFSLLSDDAGGLPRAYLNYILFDENYAYVEGGFQRVPSEAATQYETLTFDFTISQRGYIYFYVSNESNWDVDVYFDEFVVTHEHLDVVQHDAYYPFGLAHNQNPQRELNNKYLYNGKELQTDLNLGWYDYGARMYDAALGRWNSVDPLSIKYYDFSPYNYVLNNPISSIDIEGNWAIGIHYLIARNSFKANGFSHKFATRLGHYSSVYADNPTGFDGKKHTNPSHEWILRANQALYANDDETYYNLGYRNDVDYSGTVNSQSEVDPNSQLIHATRSVEEAKNGRTRSQAVSEAQSLAWNNIFSVGAKGLGENISESDYATLGLGVHALQDAERHKGAIYSSTSDMNEHSVMGDMFGNQGSTKRVTNSVAKVYGILNGNFDPIGKKSNLYVPGMSMNQVMAIMFKLINNGYNATYTSEDNNIKATMR